MADMDLMSALQMFASGAKELGTARAIASANDQVQQIKASTLDDMQKRAALQDVSNQVVQHLAMTGTPATTMQAVAGAIGPKQYAGANQMNMDALETGNKNLAAMAQQQQAFEQNPQYAIEKIKAKAANAPMNLLAQQKFKEQQDEFTTKQFATFSKTLDNTDAVRNAFGKTGQGLQRANQIDALIGKAGDSVQSMNQLPPQMVAELATATASMVKGGQAPTDADIKHFMVSSMGMDKAKAEQYLTNGVHGAEAGQFVQLYQKAAHRERAELQAQNDETVLKRAQGNLSLYKRDPDQFKQTVADRLGVSVDDVVVDPKKKTVTTKQQMQIQADTDLAMSNLNKAYIGIQSSDPAVQAQAAQVFKVLGVDPKAPRRQTLEDVKYKISRGLL
jgi:hypothetical protein